MPKSSSLQGPKIARSICELGYTPFFDPSAAFHPKTRNGGAPVAGSVDPGAKS
jgi:hypothetical protein